MSATLFKKAGLMAVSGAILMIGTMNPVQAEPLTFENKQAFEKAVKDYLIENPAVIFEEVLQSFRQKEEEAQKQAATDGIKKHIGFLTAKDAPSIGNPKADVTIVEFFDYNCGYCKRALSAIQEIVEKDKNVRFVFRDMAILGPTSRTAALWALAAHEQGKYFDYHVALMEHNGPKEEAELIKLAQKVGLDVDKMKAYADSEEASKKLATEMEIANEIGAQGTPAFIIGDEFIPGYIDAATMHKIINDQRGKNKKES